MADHDNDRPRPRRERRFDDAPHDRLARRASATSFVSSAPPAARKREDRPAASTTAAILSHRGSRGCGREAISIKQAADAHAADVGAGRSARRRCRRCKHPVEAVLLRRARAARRADDRLVSASSPSSSRLPGSTGMPKCSISPARRLDRSRDDVAPVGDRRGAEHDRAESAAGASRSSAVGERAGLMRRASRRRRPARRSGRAAPRAPAASWRRRSA